MMRISAYLQADFCYLKSWLLHQVYEERECKTWNSVRVATQDKHYFMSRPLKATSNFPAKQPSSTQSLVDSVT